MVRLQYTKPAYDDLKAIHTYISADSVANAKRFITAIKDKIKTLKNNPEIGKPVFAEKYKKLRQLLYKSYRIIYHLEENMISIITIHHQSRLLENIPGLKEYKE